LGGEENNYMVVIKHQGKSISKFKTRSKTNQYLKNFDKTGSVTDGSIRIEEKQDWTISRVNEKIWHMCGCTI